MKSKCVFPNLRAEIGRRNMTQRDLAKALGVTDRTISYKMIGKREFTHREMSVISKLLEKSMDFLFQK